MGKTKLSVMIGLATACLASSASAVTLEELAAKLDALSAENAQLRTRIEQLESDSPSVAAKNTTTGSTSVATVKNDAIMAMDHGYSYEILDATTRINRKQEYILQSKKDGKLASNKVYVSGAVTAIADYQKSNTESKFGYLMRHPTANNQRTEEVSEAAIHSTQLALTANLGDRTTAYAEMLFDPQQSFGSGTNTDLNRNQVQVRRAYIMLGNLAESPWYGALGKMAIPFGLTDTPNPFTASTVWHAFGGLANGVKFGYMNDGFNATVMGVQGGSQFRAANVPVDGSNVPSKLNNYSVDVNYTFATGDESDLLVGASYIKGSAYCQEFPVTHFNSCQEENGAYDVYAQWNTGNWMLQAEYAITEDEWPGTFNPSLPQFTAEKVESFDVGGKYRSQMNGYRVDWSADFSRFVAGPSGAPWEKQDQYVLGVAGFVTPTAKLFAEVIYTDGYAPLNFISGTDPLIPETHSDADAHSTILMLGGNVAF